MIANARMYSVSPEVAALWRELLSAIIAVAGVPMTVIEHSEPAPLDELWMRPDQGAVFMCGLPFSLAVPQPLLIAAPVPALPAYGGEARYWSEWVVHHDSAYRTVTDTLGGRIAFTVPGSQSGYAAALSFLDTARRETLRGETPLYREIVAPTITPLGALSAVIEGRADIAPIDSYAFALIRKFRPELGSQVRVVGSTSPTPIPPLVASHAGLGSVSGLDSRGSLSSRAGVDTLRQAFLDAHRTESLKPLLESLLLLRFSLPSAAAYAPLSVRYDAMRRYWHTHPLAQIVDPAFAGVA